MAAAWPRRRSRAESDARATRLAHATTSAQPSSVFRRCWSVLVLPTWLSSHAPKNAAGTPGTTSRRTRAQLTLPWRACTAPPTGFMASELTRSLAIATFGSIPNKSTNAGVMRAPPPMPATPTAKPPKSPERARSQLEGWVPRMPAAEAIVPIKTIVPV